MSDGLTPEQQRMLDRIMAQWWRWIRHDAKRYRLGNPHAPSCSYAAELERRARRALARYVKLQRLGQRLTRRLGKKVHTWRMCPSCKRANYCVGCHECQCGYTGEP